MSQPPDEPTWPDQPPRPDQPPEQPPAEWGATVPRPRQPPPPQPGAEPTRAPGQSPGWSPPTDPPTQQFAAAGQTPDPSSSAYANQPPLDPNGYGVPPGAAGHPPPSGKKNTGLLIGLGAAGLIALASIVIGVVVLTGGDDDERITSGGDSSPSAEPSDDTSEEPTEEPTTEESEPTEEPDPVPVEGRLSGDGYSYDLLDGWQDVTVEALAQDPPGAIDTVSSWGEDIESGRANLIVERGATAASDPDELRESWESNLGNAVGVTPEPGPNAVIADERALSATLESVNVQDVSVVQTAYLLVVDEVVYSIAFSAEDGDDDAQDALEEILDSWDWE